MAEQIRSDPHTLRKTPQGTRLVDVHPAWLQLMKYCAELKYGEIQSLKVQDGLPVSAEVTMKKVKFSP